MTIDLVAAAIYYALCIIFVIAAADLTCGLVHWLEDNYGQEDWPVVGASVIAPNRLHHTQPRAFVRNSWWQSAHLQIKASTAIALAAHWAGWLGWELIFFLTLAASGNEIHKYAHRSRAENGRLISWLQDYGVIQDRFHHAQHHRGRRNTHYCTITNWLNPIVDKTGCWRFMEYGIKKCTGVMPVKVNLENRANCPPADQGSGFG